LDAKTFKAATKRIMKTYQIPHRLRLRKPAPSDVAKLLPRATKSPRPASSL
jgi:hypothetical protein